MNVRISTEPNFLIIFCFEERKYFGLLKIQEKEEIDVNRNIYFSGVYAPLFLLCIMMLVGCQEAQFSIPDTADYGEERIEAYLAADSMIVEYGKIDLVRVRLDSLFTATQAIHNRNGLQAMKYAQEAYRVATLQGEEFYKGISLYYQSLIKSRWQKFGDGLEDALNDARIGRSIFAKQQDFGWLAQIENLQGIIFRKQYYFDGSGLDSAKFYLNAGLQHLESANFSNRDSLALSGELLHAIGTTYMKGDTTQAKRYFEVAEKHYKASGNLSALARLWKDLAQISLDALAFQSTDSLLRKSMEYALLEKDQAHLVDVYELLGLLYRAKYLEDINDTYVEKAIAQFKKRVLIQEENQYDSFQEIAITFHYQAYFKQSKSIAGYNRALDSALNYYHLALKDAEEEGAIRFIKDMVLNVNDLCEGRMEDRGLDCKVFLDTSTMVFVTDIYQNVLDTISNSLDQADISLQKFQREELQSEARRSRQNQIIISAVLLAFAILVFFLILQRVQQKRLLARMEALRAQINPHFMSNSLNAIESLVNTDQKEAASKYLVHFSRLTRQILNQSRETTVSLKAELKTLEHFLALEQLRFRDKLYYSIGVDEEINPLLVEIPSMILQPYVENAIWHGIKPKIGPGMLEVRVRKEGNSLIVIVEDDGIGRKKAGELKAQSSLNKQKSVGMSITKERIRGGNSLRKSQVQIQDLYDEDGESAGTRVVIQLPYKLIKSKV